MEYFIVIILVKCHKAVHVHFFFLTVEQEKVMKWANSWNINSCVVVDSLGVLFNPFKDNIIMRKDCKTSNLLWLCLFMKYLTMIRHCNYKSHKPFVFILNDERTKSGNMRFYQTKHLTIFNLEFSSFRIKRFLE